VPFLFLLLVLINPSRPVHILWFDYPANVNALYALVSFATSGIYLAFFLRVVGARLARLRTKVFGVGTTIVTPLLVFAPMHRTVRLCSLSLSDRGAANTASPLKM
jgi:hypothetical protein